jgi:hypothetical protein
VAGAGADYHALERRQHEKVLQNMTLSYKFDAGGDRWVLEIAKGGLCTLLTEDENGATGQHIFFKTQHWGEIAETVQSAIDAWRKDKNR